MNQLRSRATGALIALSLSWTGAGCSDAPSEAEAGSEGEDAEGTATDEGGSQGAEEESGEPACGSVDEQVLWANEGQLLAPMELGFADALGIDVARSGTSEMGTLTLTFETTCHGPLHLYALVWDAYGGIEPENADSLYVQVDGGEERAWLYGCETTGPDTTWHWMPVQAWTMTQCDHEPFVIEEVQPGQHQIVIRSREGGVGGIDVAAIAAVVVSHSEDADPSPFFPIPEDEE